MGRALAARLAVLMFAAAGAALAAEPPPSPAPNEGDPAQQEYLEKVKLFAEQQQALRARETAFREAFDRAPCVRAEMAVWLLIGGDGTVIEARADEGSEHPGDVRDAFAEKLKGWKLLPPPGGKPTRLRLPMGMVPATPIPARLACDAELLDAGDYHVTQLVPKIERGKWKAVCKVDGDAEVRDVKVTLKRFRTPEDDADEKTGRRVTVKGCGAPAFLFQRLPVTSDGDLPAATVTMKRDGWNTTWDVALAAISYRLRVQPKAPSKDPAEPRPWRLLLEANGGATEELEIGASAQPPTLELRWAGDLDGDGRPDFALEDRDDGVTVRLYLSTAATGGRHVRQVASTSWGGH